MDQTYCRVLSILHDLGFGENTLIDEVPMDEDHNEEILASGSSMWTTPSNTVGMPTPSPHLPFSQSPTVTAVLAESTHIFEIPMDEDPKTTFNVEPLTESSESSTVKILRENTPAYVLPELSTMDTGLNVDFTSFGTESMKSMNTIAESPLPSATSN